ncbi:MAG: hypothetical protein AB7E32_10035 [Desulfovibrio sp.]
MAGKDEGQHNEVADQVRVERGHDFRAKALEMVIQDKGVDSEHKPKERDVFPQFHDLYFSFLNLLDVLCRFSGGLLFSTGFPFSLGNVVPDLTDLFVQLAPMLLHCAHRAAYDFIPFLETGPPGHEIDRLTGHTDVVRKFLVCFFFPKRLPFSGLLPILLLPRHGIDGNLRGNPHGVFWDAFGNHLKGQKIISNLIR